MTWGDLEQLVDASDLSLRTHAVLRAYTKHINPPTDQRPYPENMIIWPSMEAVVDLSRCSQSMVQRAKHELVTKGILELVANPGRGHTPRYRVNEQKIQRDEAVLERQQQRRERRHKGSQTGEVLPPKGSPRCEPLSSKGSQEREPFPDKGSQERDPEVIPGTTKLDPEETNFFQGVDDPQPASMHPDTKEMAPKQSPVQPKTKTKTRAVIETPAPDDIAITPALEAWRDECAPGLDLRRTIQKFLHYARAHPRITNGDWTEAFCLYVLNGQDMQKAQDQAQRAAAEQRRQAQAAEMAACMARLQAEEDAQAAKLPGGADAWTDVRELRDGFYGTHVGGCGEPHQCNGPCPT
jgi:hypothetical protein